MSDKKRTFAEDAKELDDKIHELLKQLGFYRLLDWLESKLSKFKK